MRCRDISVWFASAVLYIGFTPSFIPWFYALVSYPGFIPWSHTLVSYPVFITYAMSTGMQEMRAQKISFVRRALVSYSVLTQGAFGEH